MTDDYTTAEIVRSLRRIEGKVDNLGSHYVPRGEFEAWREGIGREIGELKAARAPWWAAASVIIGGLGLAVAFITLYVNR